MCWNRKPFGTDLCVLAIEADPRSSTYLSNRAAAYMAANRYLEALEDCKLADELEPDSAKILHRLAKVYTAIGRPQEALDVYDRIPVSYTHLTLPTKRIV